MALAELGDDAAEEAEMQRRRHAQLAGGRTLQAAHRAMALYETLHDRLSLAWAKNNLALLVFKQGDLAAALRHAESSITLIEELGVEAGKAHVLMTLCELELARSNHDEATRHASAALEVAERLGETTNVGEAHVWLGSICRVLSMAVAGDVVQDAVRHPGGAWMTLRGLGVLRGPSPPR